MTVHRDDGVFKEDVHHVNRRCALPAGSDVHNYTEPVLSSLITQRRHLKGPKSTHCSRHAIKGGEAGSLVDGALALFDIAAPDPISYFTKFSAATGQFFTFHCPRGLAHAF